MSSIVHAPTKRRRQVLAALLTVVALTVACGGADSSSDAADTAGTDTTVADAPDSTPTDVVIPTTTPLPSPTPLPSSTPVPLDAPTPSAVLLATAFTNASKVTTVGIDEVFFGMTAEAAAEAASTTWIELPSGSSLCYQVTPADGPDGVTLWIVDGHVERLDIEHPDIRTPSKLGLGNTVDELRSQLGDRLSVESTGDGGQVATFTPTDPGDREFRIVFELVDDQVVRYRSGRLGVIDRASAGC